MDVALTDENGVLNAGICKAVSVFVDGPGVIQGFGSADPNSGENFFDTTASTYEGRIRAAIRAAGKGTITAEFRSEGCETARVSVEAV